MIIEAKELLTQVEQNNHIAALSKSLKQNSSISFLHKFNRLIQNDYVNASLNVEQIATKLAVSERQLYRNIKEYSEVTPSNYLKYYRLEKAMLKMVKGGELGNISFDVGFASQSYFSSCFKKQFGQTPTDFVNDFHDSLTVGISDLDQG